MSGGIASSSGQGTASPGLTIALVGIAITASLGTVEPSNADIVALTGQGITTSQGTLTAIRGKPLVTISQGTAVVSATVPLVGSLITGSQGTTTPNADDTVTLTGQGIAVGQGTLEAYKSEALSGAEIAAAIETIAPTLRPTDIEGQQANSAPGSVSAASDDVTVNISGHESTFELGSVVVGGQGLAGAAATPAAGSSTPSTDVALTGAASACAQGAVTAAQEASEDTFISSSSGAVASARSVALTGSEAVGAQGSVGITGDTTAALTGEAITAEQGAALANFGPTLTGQASAGAQYFVGAPGGDVLTGAEASVIAGTIHVTNDREYALSGAQTTLSQGTLSPRIAPALVGQSQGTGIGEFQAQPDRKPLLGQRITTGQGFMHPPGGLSKGAMTRFGFTRQHHPRHPHVPKDILEIYYEEQEIKRQELKKAVKKAEKIVTPEKVLAARERAESPLPANPSLEDTAQVIAAILKRARDEDLAAIKSPLATAEIDARNDEDLLALIL